MIRLISQLGKIFTIDKKTNIKLTAVVGYHFVLIFEHILITLNLIAEDKCNII